MKYLLLLAVLLLIVISTQANPITPQNLARVWFDDGDLYLHLDHDIYGVGYLDNIPVKRICLF